MNEIFGSQYHEFKNEKVYGTYMWRSPALHINDLDLIQLVIKSECVNQHANLLADGGGG